MNGRQWKIYRVAPFDNHLTDRTGLRRVATTDSYTNCIYLSSYLKGDFLIRVLLHELGHCVLFSYYLLEEIHNMTYPDYWIDMEEWICNFVADYGFQIFKQAYSFLGYDAWRKIPGEMDRLFLSKRSVS